MPCSGFSKTTKKEDWRGLRNCFQAADPQVRRGRGGQVRLPANRRDRWVFHSRLQRPEFAQTGNLTLTAENLDVCPPAAVGVQPRPRAGCSPSCGRRGQLDRGEWETLWAAARG